MLALFITYARVQSFMNIFILDFLAVLGFYGRFCGMRIMSIVTIFAKRFKHIVYRGIYTRGGILYSMNVFH